MGAQRDSPGGTALLMGGLSDSKSVFLFVNENMSWMLVGTVSFEMFLLSTQDKYLIGWI